MKPEPWQQLSRRQSDSHKGDFGRVVMIGGSRGMSGAIALSAMAALKSGSGLVTAVVPDRCLETVASFHPGIMTLPMPDTPLGEFAAPPKKPPKAHLDTVLSKADAVGCGPGMRTGDGAVRLVEKLLQRTQQRRVIDADGLNVIAAQTLLDSPALPRDQSRLVLTPHPGELARLTGVPASEREAQIDAAASISESLGLTIVVKGGPTVVVGPDGSKVARHVNQTGNPGMATAGSGDVLTGIITSLLGQGYDAFSAARLGVFLHGLAGDLAADTYSQPGMTCQEVLAALPEAIKRVTGEGFSETDGS